MRNLGAIVGILLGIAGNAWQNHSTGSSIALQLVGDESEWLLSLDGAIICEGTARPQAGRGETAAEYR